MYRILVQETELKTFTVLEQQRLQSIMYGLNNIHISL